MRSQQQQQQQQRQRQRRLRSTHAPSPPTSRPIPLLLIDPSAALTPPPKSIAWIPAGILTAEAAAFLADIDKPKVYFRKLKAITQDFMGADLSELPESSPSRSILERKKEQFIALTILILRARAAFRRLVSLYLLRLINRKVNATDAYSSLIDPITLEPINQPVTLYDFKNRWRYTFEARALHQSMRAQLSCTLYGYPAPAIPRNPVTNIPLRVSQLIAVHRRLLSYGVTSWQLEAFMAGGMNLEKFARGHIIALHTDIQEEEIMEAAPTAAETLQLFFLDMCEESGVIISQSFANTFLTAISDRAWTQHPYMAAWKRLYMTLITYCDEITADGFVLFHANAEVYRRVQIAAGNLIRCFSEFYREYMEYAVMR